MKKIISITLAIIMVLGISCFALTPEEAAGDLGKYGIMGGFPDGSLRLEQNVTRAQMAKMITIAMGEEGLAGMPLSFSDVPATHWASPFIAFTQVEGIVGGFPNGTFKPEDNVTCAQVIKMVTCMLKYDEYLLSYRKHLTNPQLYYPQDYIAAALDSGLIEGLDIGDGNKPATRGFVAVVMSRALDAPIAYDPDNKGLGESGFDWSWQLADGKDGRPLKTLRQDLGK